MNASPNVVVTKVLALLCVGVALLRPEWRANLGAQGPDGVGYEPPPPPCSCQQRTELSGGSAISLSEGNLREDYDVARVRSAFGATIQFSLTYNSANADGSKSQADTGVGLGWTNSYNIFLFTQPQQPANLFRMDALGRVTTFRPNGDGTFSPNDGYFELLTANAGGTLTVRDKRGVQHTFALVPETSFPSPVVAGPVFRLTRIEDRNGNVTTLTYAGGDLIEVKDTFNRVLALEYDADHHLRQLIDPANRLTTLSYEPAGTLREIRDPEGRFLTYTYNGQHQMRRKVDRDGRIFEYRYEDGKPVTILDMSGASLFGLANPKGWAIDEVALDTQLTREYIPTTTSETDGRGSLWRYSYDTQGYITTVEAPDGGITSYTYDPNTLNTESTTDANGHTSSYAYDARGNLATTTDALGHVTAYEYEPVFNQVTKKTVPNGTPSGAVTRYAYDSAGNLVTEIDPLGGVLRWTYDSNGNVLTETDKRGNTTRHEYDATGNRVRTIDPLGHATAFEYDIVGNLLRRTNANGHPVSYTYDALDRLVVESDALGSRSRTTFDGEGNRLETIDPVGHRTQFEYDWRSRLSRSLDALGQSTSFVYDGNNNRTAMIDATGHTTHSTYDARNRLASVTDAIGASRYRTYDPVGNLITETDANGHTTTYRYDELNRRVESRDALAAITAYGYDTGGGCTECIGPTRGSGLVTSVTDANGKVTYTKYDGLDRPIGEIRKEGDIADVIDASDAVVRYTYDASGNRVSLTEPDGHTTTYQYDALNRRTAVTDGAGDTTRTAYDFVGNIRSVTAPNTNVTTFTHDAVNRLIRVHDRIGLVRVITYDRDGNRVIEVDANGALQRFLYDALHRLVRETDPKGNATHYEYDAVGNLMTVVDREGRRTSHAYDAVYRRIRTLDEGAPSQPGVFLLTLFEHDPAGNLVRIVDPQGNTTSYAYDAVNRRISETYPDAPPNRRTFTYDPVGNLVVRTDQKGHATSYVYNDFYFLIRRDYANGADDLFSYDLSGRMLTADRDGWQVTFAYDGANRLTQTVQGGRAIRYAYVSGQGLRHITYPGGRVVTEKTDLRERLTQVYESAAVPIATYRYDPGDRVVERRYRNGTAAAYTYDANDWLSRLDHRTAARTLVGLDYAHDKEGNRQFERKRHSPGDSEAYRYDGIHRLIDYKVGTLVGSTVPMPSTQTAYDLDLLGNWRTKTVDGVAELRTHNQANEITSIDSVPVFHDDSGNLADDRQRSYQYDDENRLVAVSRLAPAQIVGEYQYDALGRRVRKNDHLGQETFYFYDDQRVIEEQDVKGVTRATYVYGRYLDEVLTMDRGGQTMYYHQNGSYSVYALSNASAVLVEGYRYDPYGRQTVITPGANGVVDFGGDDMVFAGGASSVGNAHMFTGRQLDAETGLLFYRARHYDPVKGRFVQRDPIDYAAGLNLYEYTRSNPLNRVDPSGLAEVTIDPATVDGIGYGVGTEARPEGRSLVFMKVTGTCCECNQAAVAAGTDKEKKYGIRKIVIAFRLALFVSPAISRGEVGADGGTLRGTYGHEQKHLVMMMKEIKKNKAAIEKLFAPLEEACELSEKKCNEQMTARFVQGKADIAQTVAPFITYGYDHAGSIKADGHPTAKEQPEPIGDVKPMAEPFPPKGEEAGWYLFPSSIYKEAYRATLKKKK